MKSIIVFLFGLLYAGFSIGASFDCSATGTSTEKLICSDATLSKMDEELTSNYKQVLASLDGSNKEKFVLEQKDWLKYSRSLCGDVACLRRSYQTRIKLFQACNGVCMNLAEEYVSNSESHNLITLRNSNERNRSFSKDLTTRKFKAVLGCETLVDVSVGTAHGNDSYGGLCKLKDAKEESFYMVCNDDMIGHFNIIQAASNATRYELADFVVKNCYGG